jgi:hypothetical protein
MMYGDSVAGFAGAVRQGTESVAAAAAYFVQMFMVFAFSFKPFSKIRFFITNAGARCQRIACFSGNV